MAKVTSKLQVTVPKAIATAYAIRPGDEISWLPGGDLIRVVPPRRARPRADRAARLRLFDRATARVRRRKRLVPKAEGDRGWTRAELYVRGRAR